MNNLKLFLMLLLVGSIRLSVVAQACDPGSAPTGLTSTYTPGTGALLEWDAVPGSVGVQLRVVLPSGSTITRRILGFEIDQYMVADALLVPGTYTWRVQAACSPTPPFNVTLVSESATFQKIMDCDSVTDIDGNMYSTVQIGSQCWMAENLKVEHYQNGDSIPTRLGRSAWYNTFMTNKGAFAKYDNLPINKKKYGLLYNWYAVVDDRGLCPTGWHVPSVGEWRHLICYLDPSTCGSCAEPCNSLVAGGLLKSTGTISAGTGLWNFPNSGANNSSGFTALPGGERNDNGNYYELGNIANFWSSSQSSPYDGWLRAMFHDSESANLGDNEKQGGFSVRCVKD